MSDHANNTLIEALQVLEDVVQASEDKKANIISDYAALYSDLKRPPKMDELTAKGYTKDSIKHHFSSLARLDGIAREVYPDQFFDVSIDSMITQDTLDIMRQKIASHRRFVITTAVTGCAVDHQFLESIRSYCLSHEALLCVLVASDPAHAKGRSGYGFIDRALTDDCIILEDSRINSNLLLSTIKLSAKQQDPSASLSRIGQRNGSLIFASPKQRLQLVATSNVKLPHAIMSTGAITVANYDTDRYMSERTAYLAHSDHIMGALIVELEDDNIYHYRQFQAAPDGSFPDLAVRYFPDGSTMPDEPSLVMGDWHSNETDPAVRQGTDEICQQLGIVDLIVHDGFNGESVNHHEEHNLLSKAMRFKNSAITLEQEIKGFASDLSWMTARVKGQVVVVKSNHDEFLSKHYLQKAKYAQDPQNHYYSLDLAKAMMEGHDALQFAVSKNLTWAENKKIRWLERDEDYMIGGVQCGAHGDKGPNGSRGSLASMEKAYGSSVTGHSHTPGILRGAWAVGTSTYLKLGYNQGPSSWLQAHCLVYADGSRQLINFINGRWRA